MRRTLLIIIALLFGSPASAQEMIAEYLTWLGPQDVVNSRGIRLKSFGAVLAQDRANYHRFGIRQELDTSDPIFGDRTMRSALPQLYQAGRQVDAYIFDDVMSGQGHYVIIRIMGNGGRVTHVDVYEGAG
ncbi:MAG: hypothetical protein ABJN26_00355 [Stappiaceae bacterium]